MRFRRLLLVAIIAALTSGGTFTCTCNSHDDEDDFHHPHTSSTDADTAADK